MEFDPQVRTALEKGDHGAVFFAMVPTAILSSSVGENADLTMIKDVAYVPDLSTAQATNAALLTAWGEAYQGGQEVKNLRRLNQLVTWD